jgi:hypothetical protein
MTNKSIAKKPPVMCRQPERYKATIRNEREVQSKKKTPEPPIADRANGISKRASIMRDLTT